MNPGTALRNNPSDREKAPSRSAEFRQFLLDLGFTAAKRGKFWFFEHSPSETTYLFRPYRAVEKVSLIDIQSTRRHLDLRGVLDEQAFANDRLQEQPLDGCHTKIDPARPMDGAVQ